MSTATRTPVTARPHYIQALTFNQYTEYRAHIGDPINGVRELFHAYCADGEGHTPPTLLDTWEYKWRAFEHTQDAQDHRDTQMDALR